VVTGVRLQTLAASGPSSVAGLSGVSSTRILTGSASVSGKDGVDSAATIDRQRLHRGHTTDDDDEEEGDDDAQSRRHINSMKGKLVRARPEPNVLRCFKLEATYTYDYAMPYRSKMAGVSG
jgi:hypothetical protein